MSKKNSKKKTKQGVKKTEKIQEKNETKRQESLDTKKRNVTNNEYEENQKESKKKMIIQYMIPLALQYITYTICSTNNDCIVWMGCKYKNLS